MLIRSLSVRQRSEVTTLRKPREFGCYSRTDKDEIFVNDARNLSYFYFTDNELAKTQSLDLSAGRREFQDRSETISDPCSMKGLLDTIRVAEEKVNKRLGADIITFRGIIRKLISYGVEESRFTDPINLQVLVFDGQIFIKDINQNSDLAKKNEVQSNYGIDLGSFSGYKFETLTTIPKPFSEVSRETIEERPKQIVSNGNEYASVVQTGIGSSKIILGAEVDAIFDFKPTPEENEDNLAHYIELKCTKVIQSQRDCLNFEKKLFRTWLQCFLVGIPRITYGFRNELYQLKTIEEYQTVEIPQLVNPSMKEQFNDAIKWYGCFIDWLLQTLPRDSKDTEMLAYKLTNGEQSLRLEQIDPTSDEYTHIINNPDFINAEFKKWRLSLKR
ncbi:decapping nuclease Rai1p [Monosporozyma servazzii]